MKPKLFDLAKCGNIKTAADRWGIFTFLRHHQFAIPDFDKVLELYARHDNDLSCVIYMDNTTLKTRKMKLREAIKYYPDNLASLYIGQKGVVTSSTRMFQIGDMSYWFDFSSINDWRSNRGEFKCEFSKSMQGYHPNIDLPLFSIDFVKDDIDYAIDFDLIPGAGKTSLRDILTPKQAVKMIRAGIKYYERH